MVKRGQGPEGSRLGISLEMDSMTFTGIHLSISWSIPDVNTVEGDVIGECCPQVTESYRPCGRRGLLGP